MSSVPLFIGMDYSDNSVQLCAIDQDGQVQVNRSCRNDWRELAAAVAGKGAVKRAAIEACSGAADLAEELVARAGWHVELGHPHYVAKLKGSPDKSDFSDARVIADLTRVGYLPRTWLAPAFLRDLRQLVNYRQHLVNQRRALKLRVGALLREHRAKPPKASNGKPMSRWTIAWCHFARSTTQLSDHARWIVNQHLDQIAQLDAQVEQADQRLRGATASDPIVARLLKLDGVGEVTAWVLRAFIGTFERFTNGKQLARYCGLSPRNASSGERQSDAGVIKASNPLLRATIVQASHRLIRTIPRWRDLANTLQRRGKPVSVIAAAVGNRWMRRMHFEMTKLNERNDSSNGVTVSSGS